VLLPEAMGPLIITSRLLSRALLAH
jgi:hypothetical protein